jgi:hypothetical protein
MLLFLNISSIGDKEMWSIKPQTFFGSSKKIIIDGSYKKKPAAFRYGRLLCKEKL